MIFLLLDSWILLYDFSRQPQNNYYFSNFNPQMSIKDFSILAKLGQGAYSSVFKVERLADHKQYALKKVKLGNLSDKQLDNAVNEVRILASITSQNIVSYKEAFLEGKNLCIVMEFADGGDLYQRIVENKKKKKHFEQNEIWNVLIQISRGLKTLHDLQIFHRDLKSANVFLTKSGIAKLGDMNVSKVAKNGLLYTQTGTPYYASPQVWKDKPYDSKSDIWSFGCVIYEMTTLEPPFKAEDMQGLFESVTKGVYPPIPSFYSKQLASVIKLMLQQNPANRPSCDKLLKSALLIKKSKELNIEPTHESNSELLKTIRIPKKLLYLTDFLPKSNYESLKNSQGIFRQRRASEKTHESRQRQNTLPKLEGIVRYHEDIIRKKQQQRGKRSKNSSPYQQGSIKNINLSYDLKSEVSKQKQDIREHLKRIHAGSRDRNSLIKGLPPLKRY